MLAAETVVGRETEKDRARRPRRTTEGALALQPGQARCLLGGDARAGGVDKEDFDEHGDPGSVDICETVLAVKALG